MVYNNIIAAAADSVRCDTPPYPYVAQDNIVRYNINYIIARRVSPVDQNSAAGRSLSSYG